MTHLEMVEYQINYMMSLYKQKKNEPGFRIKLAMLISQRQRLLKKESAPQHDNPL